MSILVVSGRFWQMILLFLFLVFIVAPTMALGAGLTDISAYRNEAAIRYLYDAGIISGYADGSFKPYHPVNRAEFTKIVVSATFNQEEIKGCLQTRIPSNWNVVFFPDVLADSWYARYVCMARLHGMIHGYSDGQFKPDNLINTAEAIKILVEAHGYKVEDQVREILYADVDNAQWYAPYVKAARDNNLLETAEYLLYPASFITRGSVSEMVYRSIRSRAVASDYVYVPATADFFNAEDAAADVFDAINSAPAAGQSDLGGAGVGGGGAGVGGGGAGVGGGGAGVGGGGAGVAAVAANGSGAAAGVAGQQDFVVNVTAVTSSRVTVSWPSVPGASQVKIFIGPEPVSAAGDPFPIEKLVATLNGTADSYTIDSIAAASDLFIRVAATTSSSELVGYAHAFTKGGPRAALETRLRAAHSYGSKTLMLVLANEDAMWTNNVISNNLGTDWQSGSWQVQRSNGDSITVMKVFRHSRPAAQPNYAIGYANWTGNQHPSIDHRIFLELDEKIGSNEMLTITHQGKPETNLSFIMPFSDRYTVTSLIQLNQVGYNPLATLRYAYVSGWKGDGGAADVSNLVSADVLIESLNPFNPRTSVLQGLSIVQRSSNDLDAGGEVREVDLSALPAASGVRYRVRIPGVGVSWPTTVSEDGVFKSFYTIWRGLFHNRWCGNLTPATTEWSRGPDHCEAYFVKTGNVYDKFDENSPPPTNNLRPLAGGHHDAGDFDIRPYHVVVAQYLMRAYEIHPAFYGDGQLTIPESGNGIPDVLDEALWSVSAWQALQNPDGSVRSGVESYAHPRGYYFANEDELPYWTHDPLVWHTAWTAGLFAQAAYLVKPFDAVRATQLEAAARAAYAYGVNHGAVDRYLLYGASELYRLTGEAAFAADFEKYWFSIDKYGRGAFDNIQIMAKIYPGSFDGYAPAMADFVMGYYEAFSSSAVSPAIKATIQKELTSRADEAADNILYSESAHRNGWRNFDLGPSWGQTTTPARHLDMVYQRLQAGNLSASQKQKYLNALSLAADYTLGANPYGQSYITGLGSRYPMEPLHLDSLAFMKVKGMPPIPGLPVFGPVDNFPTHSYYGPASSSFYPAVNSQPLGYRYSDTRSSVVTNEFTVWENQAPQAELFAAILGAVKMPPASWLPGGADHLSTFP